MPHCRHKGATMVHLIQLAQWRHVVPTDQERQIGPNKPSPGVPERRTQRGSGSHPGGCYWRACPSLRLTAGSGGPAPSAQRPVSGPPPYPAPCGHSGSFFKSTALCARCAVSRTCASRRRLNGGQGANHPAPSDFRHGKQLTALSPLSGSVPRNGQSYGVRGGDVLTSRHPL